jgi:Ca2+-binding EF-hand superfamily protein
MFERLDRDHSGALSREEVTFALRRLSPMTKAPDVEALFDAFDRDKNGTLEEDDFQKLCK